MTITNDDEVNIKIYYDEAVEAMRNVPVRPADTERGRGFWSRVTVAQGTAVDGRRRDDPNK